MFMGKNSSNIIYVYSVAWSLVTSGRTLRCSFLYPSQKKCFFLQSFVQVYPSIHSTVICRNCLRYNHTAKFWRGKSRCSHCLTILSLYESIQIFLHCNASHDAADRSYVIVFILSSHAKKIPKNITYDLTMKLFT